MDYIVITTAVKEGFIGSAVKVVGDNLDYVVHVTEPKPTRSVAKSEAIAAMRDHLRIPATGKWRLE